MTTAALNPELVQTLRVQNARFIATDIREIELVAPDGGELPAFTAGAHVLIQAPIGVTRRYSLTNAPVERHRYVIAVKREAGGRGGSISVVDDLGPGDVVHVSLPRNEFELAESAPGYLFIAGGIGITPIRSMIRHVLPTGKPFRLFYLTREPALTAFRDEWSAPDVAGRVVLHHDFGDPARAYDLWPVLEKPNGMHVYCCGPKGLMEAVQDMTGHWPTSAIHFEDFGAGTPVHRPDDTAFVVRLGTDGAAMDVGADTSILEALRAHGHRLPSSCESGTCGTCRMRLLAGEADHRDFVLSDAERQCEIMVCVSRARSAELVVARLSPGTS
jgi:phthalate 4,5-dioxygenase reductase subunit